METVTSLFYTVIMVCAILGFFALLSISDYLRHIRNDLREYFKAEERRWTSDYEWRNSE